VTELDCSRCGTTFDTDREGVTPGQDTTRCPSCGASNNEPATDGGETIAVDSAGVTVRITIDVEPN
jgi:NAD-dependent SIR2 family protein deacetylase